MTFFANTKKDDETLKTLKDNLSSKRGVINMDENGKDMWAYREKDVKKSIKRLKEDLERDGYLTLKVREYIDEEFGEDLI